MHHMDGGIEDVGMDIFEKRFCLPSDNKMTVEQQNRIIEVIKEAFLINLLKFSNKRTGGR